MTILGTDQETNESPSEEALTIWEFNTRADNAYIFPQQINDRIKSHGISK